MIEIIIMQKTIDTVKITDFIFFFQREGLADVTGTTPSGSWSFV
jgi:hypothetical protein